MDATLVTLTRDVFPHTQSLSCFHWRPGPDGTLCCSADPPELCKAGPRLWPTLHPCTHRRSFSALLSPVTNIRFSNYLKHTEAEDFVQSEYDVGGFQRRGLCLSKTHNHTPVLSQDNHPFINSVPKFDNHKKQNKHCCQIKDILYV